jgi:prevent-host-death family protein
VDAYRGVYLCTIWLMSTSVSVSEARAALPELLDRVLAGDEVTVTRHGQPVAVLVRPDALRFRRAEAALAGAERVRELLEEARRSPLPVGGAITPERADALVAEVRSGRSAR